MSDGTHHHQHHEPDRPERPTAPRAESKTPPLFQVNLPDFRNDWVDKKGITDIKVAESNITVRYVNENGEGSMGSGDVIPGELELELRSLTGKEIDTVTISVMTRETFQIILDTITASNREEYRNSWQGSAPFLTHSRLEEILTVAGAQGATIKTRALKGISPRHRADDYDEKLTRKPDNEELQKQALKNLEYANTLFLIKQGFDLARQRNTRVIIAPAGEGGIISAIRTRRSEKQTIIWIKEDSSPTESLALASPRDLIWTPQTEEFSRDSQDRLALLTALIDGKAKLEEQVLVFQRPEESMNPDGFRLRFPRSIFPWLSNEALISLQSLPDSHRHCLMQVTELAMKLAVESIEGKNIGASFVIADYNEVSPHLSPKLLNPFDPQRDSIFNPSLVESIRAYASSDGATVISPLGRVHASGLYITCRTDGVEGLESQGSRHRSAAAITAETGAVAVVISESSGTVTIMAGGRAILELPRS